MLWLFAICLHPLFFIRCEPQAVMTAVSCPAFQKASIARDKTARESLAGEQKNSDSAMANAMLVDDVYPMALALQKHLVGRPCARRHPGNSLALPPACCTHRQLLPAVGCAALLMD